MLSKPTKFGLILLIIVLVVILGILTELITFPIEMITTTTTTTVVLIPTTTTTTLAIVPTTTVKETTTTTTTTTMPVTIYKSYCEDNECWLYEGESINVKKENITYTITLVGVTDEDTAVIDVDGETDTFDQGEDKIVNGLGIYLMKVFYFPKEEQLGFVQFLFY